MHAAAVAEDRPLRSPSVSWQRQRPWHQANVGDTVSIGFVMQLSPFFSHNRMNLHFWLWSALTADHDDVTATASTKVRDGSATRHPNRGLFVATLVQTAHVAPSVKSFVFRVEHPCLASEKIATRNSVRFAMFSFRAGQAVDLMVEEAASAAGGSPACGTYSIASTPSQFAATGKIELVVKNSHRHAVSFWLHNHAKIGGKVQLARSRSSKLAWASPLDDGAGPLLLLAGGLGINPLFSILKHAEEWVYGDDVDQERRRHLTRERAANETRGATDRELPPIALLYSARTSSHFVHKAAIDALAARHPQHVAPPVFTVTRELDSADKCEHQPGAVNSSPLGRQGSSIVHRGCAGLGGNRVGRIDQALIRAALEQLTNLSLSSAGRPAAIYPDDLTDARKNVRCYICGPPPMVDAMAAIVEDSGVGPERIHYEKWW